MNEFVRSRLYDAETFANLGDAGQDSRVYDISGDNTVSLGVQFTRATGTAVKFTFYTSDDGVTWYQLTSPDVSAGVGSRYQYVDTYTTSASVNYDIRLTQLQRRFFKYHVAVTDGTTDSVTVALEAGAQ